MLMAPLAPRAVHFMRLCALAVVACSVDARANPLDHLRTTDDIGLHKVPHTGVSRILVIPTRVNRDFPAGELERLRQFFNPDGGVGTFRDYWRVNSNGAYDPVPTVVNPVVYRDRCPIPTKPLNACRFTLDDFTLIAQGGPRVAFEDVLMRVRDEQGVDLAEFDINSGAGPGPDGYFDGVVMESDMYSGIGFPLAVLGNQVTVPVTRGVDIRDGGMDVDAGPLLSCGIVAMSPPAEHEFGHILGFIDLYGGAPVNDLMMDTQSTLGAFSRLQIGWGDVQDITLPAEVDLTPTLQRGSILRIRNIGVEYFLIENRGGVNHTAYDHSAPGIYVYNVNESELPQDPLGFIDFTDRQLYLPNRSAPYLFISLPLECRMGSATDPGTCALTTADEARVVGRDNDDGGVVFGMRRGPTQPDGTVRVRLTLGREPPPSLLAIPDAGSSGTDGGEEAPPPGTRSLLPGCSHALVSPGFPVFLLGCAALWPRIRRRARRL